MAEADRRVVVGRDGAITIPAVDESGLLRIFPAGPTAWQDVEFHDLRTEGAFLV